MNSWWQGIDEKKRKKVFARYGIQDKNKWEPASLNLVLGGNGAGKSRLLCAVRDICREEKRPVLYMDFTKIGAECSPSDTDNDCLFDSLIYQGALPENSLLEFIPFVESNVVEFSRSLNALNNKDQRMAVGRRRADLNKFLKDQLGRELKFNSDNRECFITSRQAEHGDLPLSEAIKEMSPGERVILYFSLGHFCVKSDEVSEKEFVLLLDEPEIHLHPKALLGLVRAIMGLNRVGDNATVLIASHSIFLIPLFQFKQLTYMKNGVIEKAGSAIYANAYNTLVSDVGSEDDGLREMLTSISQWNFSKYLTECLSPPPDSDNVTRDDPQLKKMIKVLKPLAEGGRELHLLDYGGGSGRIAQCLRLRFAEAPNDPLIHHLKYDVYDPVIQWDKLPTEDWLNKKYEKAQKNLLGTGTYDLVILYNVLHEVDVTEWATTLNEILKLLKKDGILLFSERKVLSQGERPYGKSGYLLLEETELRRLFKDGGLETIYLTDGQEDPTICCALHEPHTISVTETQVAEAVTALKKRSWEAVKSTIDGGRRIKPREYAFYCQQYINATHAEDLLASREKKDSYTSGIAGKMLGDLVREYEGVERIRKIEERSKICDEEGNRCQEWLKDNAPGGKVINGRGNPE